MELKELIEKRWQCSAEKYSESIQRELKLEINRWKGYIAKHISVKEKVKILDIGCGPGFFTILFSGEDHETIGIDGSSNMVAEAVLNAERQNANADFKVMDCHHLEFADDTFDLVVSRNVVWTLYDPAAAYREWRRVLKPGGKIMTFDAAWNREYHDPKVMEKKKLLRSQLKAQERQEYFCEDQELGLELDLKSVLGMEKRPQWDRECLESLGMKVKVDENAWKILWDEHTQLKSGATPMFMILAEK